jgi:hypothetical protein
MEGLCFIIVGRPRMGKSYFIKNKLSKVHETTRLVNDIQREYVDLYKEPFNEDFADFLSKAKKARNSFIVFEEATAYLSDLGSRTSMRHLIISKAHTGNMFFIVFHSLADVPEYIYRISNYIVLFKTADKETKVVERFNNDKLTKAFLDLKEAPMLNNGSRDYSPYIIVSI